MQEVGYLQARFKWLILQFDECGEPSLLDFRFPRVVYMAVMDFFRGVGKCAQVWR